LIADCQDETLRRELLEHGLEPNDAEHLTQAVCNDCGVFLTRDEATIINPHRQWLEQRFPNLKIRLPSELLNELASAPPSGVAVAVVAANRAAPAVKREADEDWGN
jgi:hypothetical protein